MHCARSGRDLNDFKKRFKNPRFGQSKFSCKIAHLLNSSCFIAAIMLPSLAGVCTVLERPVFTSVTGVTLHDTQKMFQLLKQAAV